MGLVVVEVAPGAPRAEVEVVHVGGIVVGMSDGEFDADFARQALGAEGGAGSPILIAPDLGAFLGPDHVVAPDPAEFWIAGFPGIGEDPGVERLPASFTLMVSPPEHARPNLRAPLAAIQVTKLGADRHRSSLAYPRSRPPRIGVDRTDSPLVHRPDTSAGLAATRANPGSYEQPFIEVEDGRRLYLN